MGRAGIPGNSRWWGIPNLQKQPLSIPAFNGYKMRPTGLLCRQNRKYLLRLWQLPWPQQQDSLGFLKLIHAVIQQRYMGPYYVPCSMLSKQNTGMKNILRRTFLCRFDSYAHLMGSQSCKEGPADLWNPLRNPKSCLVNK